MPLYTFYPIHSDGLCETFQCFDLDGCRSVGDFAVAILRNHPSAATVDVYDDHRKIMTHQRGA